MLPPPVVDSVNLFFYNSIRFTRNHVCIHARLLHMTSCTFGCGGVGGVVTSACTWLDLTYPEVGWGGMVTSLCTCSHLSCYAPHVFLASSTTSSMCCWSLPEKWEDKMVARSHLARRFWTNVGITVKVSFQTLSIQRTRRTNYWMLRSGAMSTNGNGDTIIAMPCGRDGGHIRPYPFAPTPLSFPLTVSFNLLGKDLGTRDF